MSKLMYADMGLSVVAGLTQFGVAREQSKLQAAMQKYQNTMSALSTGQSLNNITRNAVAVRDNRVFADLSIQTSAMEEQAAFKVEAAAAGVIGNSVAVGLRARQADAARAQTSLARKFNSELLAVEDQKKQVRLSEVYNQDISPISRPNLGAALLNTGMQMVDIWDKHNPEDRRSSSFLSKGK